MDIKHCTLCGDKTDDGQDGFPVPPDAVVKKFRKGEFIARQGDVVGSLYMLSRGSVKTEMITESGGVLSVKTVRAPRPLAPAFLFAENNRFPVDVVSLEECEVVMIPKESVMRHLAGNEDFLRYFMALSANRTQFLSERLQLFSIRTIKGKLAYYIGQRTLNGSFKMERNQKELAEYFGVTRPALARSFSEMIDEGAVSRDGKILDADLLKNYIL